MRASLLVVFGACLALSGCLMQQPVAMAPEPVQAKPVAAKPAPKRVQAAQRPAPVRRPAPVEYQGGGEAGGWDG